MTRNFLHYKLCVFGFGFGIGPVFRIRSNFELGLNDMSSDQIHMQHMGPVLQLTCSPTKNGLGTPWLNLFLCKGLLNYILHHLTGKFWTYFVLRFCAFPCIMGGGPMVVELVDYELVLVFMYLVKTIWSSFSHGCIKKNKKMVILLNTNLYFFVCSGNFFLQCIALFFIFFCFWLFII